MIDLPPVGYYFQVNLLFPPDPGGWDMRFQKVSGFNVAMTPADVQEGGQNLFGHRLPTAYKYNNLVLERGYTKLSVLNIQFQVAMNTFRFNPTTILVTLLNEEDAPAAGWVFSNAYPVRWASSDLNANENGLLIDTLELAYSRFTRISL